MFVKVWTEKYFNTRHYTNNMHIHINNNTIWHVFHVMCCLFLYVNNERDNIVCLM